MFGKKKADKFLTLIRNESFEKIKEYLNKKKVSKKQYESFVLKEDNPLYISMVIRKDLEISQEIIKSMIKVKADINKVDESQQTILHYLCNVFTTDGNFIMAVLDYPGVDVNARNKDKQTPLHIFCNNFANVQSYKTILQKFVELKAEIDATNSFNETPLIKTVKNMKLRGLIVQFLIDNGANINVANKTKNTVLHFVVALHRVDLINILVKGGADIYFKNKKNESPLSLAKEKGQLPVLHKLYEVHNLLQWLNGISEEFTNLYARKCMQQEIHPKMLKNLDDNELSELLEYLAEEEAHVAILKESIKKFELINIEEKEIKEVTVSSVSEQRKTTQITKKFNLPCNIDDWAIDTNSIEFTGETKPSRSNKVGTGSTCSVYRGLYHKENKDGSLTDYDVAVKILDEGIDLGENSEFQHEFTIQKSLQHENIVKFFGICADESVSIIMEFCAQFSLFDVLNDKNLQIDFPTAINFCEQICKGMKVLHDNTPSILHRDFKSLNVLVTDKYKLKISDFGLSRYDTEENRNKELRDLSGTIPYCCPEIIGGGIGDNVYTTKSDIYSLGIVFWEIFRRVVYGAYDKPWFNEYSIPASNDFAILNLITSGKRPTLNVKQYSEAEKNYVPPMVHDLYYKCVSDTVAERPSIDECLEILGKMRIEYNENMDTWKKYYVAVGFKKV